MNYGGLVTLSLKNNDLLVQLWPFQRIFSEMVLKSDSHPSKKFALFSSFKAL